MDLSKGLDTINHSLLMAKLEAYCFSVNSLIFLKSYWSNWFQQIHTEFSFRKWAKLSAGVSEGSLLGPMLLGIFLNYIFLFINNSNLCNYADDYTLYAIGKKP